jgi:hypothetical protein
MKMLLATIVVMALARLIFGLVLLIVHLPIGFVLEQWGDKSPHLMEELRFRIRAITLFLSMFIGVIAAVIFSYCIFYMITHTTVETSFPLVAVTVPMLFSIRADIWNWRRQSAGVWNKNDVSDIFRKRFESEYVTIHRVGVIAKACAMIAAWTYFLFIGDQIILPYLGIE